jgi:hypothetical protein
MNKVALPSLLIGLIFNLVAITHTSGQNMPPVVTITEVSVDESAKTVSITYDLADPDGNLCAVSLGISLDGGETFLVEDGSINGEVGVDISPGQQKEITWNWNTIPDIWQVRVRVLAEDGFIPDIQAMVDQVDSARLLSLLHTIAIPRHHNAHAAGLNAVKDTVLGTFNSLGFQTTQQPVFFQGANIPNILARQPGLNDEAATLIIDGHYDGVAGTPGADDNATAVVAMMEIARILAPYHFRKSLRYIGFSFEEQGLIGSQAYVNSGIRPYENLEGTLNLEMIGYYSEEPNSQQLPAGFEFLFPNAVQTIQNNQFKGDFITVVGNQNSQPLINAYLQASDLYVPDLKYIPLAVPGNGQIAPDLRRSDHSRFWDAGYQALMLTDGSEFRNKNYHTPADTIGSLNMTFLARVTQATLATAAMLAEPIQAGMDVFDLSTLVSTHHHLSFPCEVQVHPNPARDELRIQLGHCFDERLSLRLFTLDGREVLFRALNPASESELYTFPLPVLPSGSYLLVLDEGHSSYTQLIGIE